jgi:glutaminyl-peptide cyclotransferase
MRAILFALAAAFAASAPAAAPQVYDIEVVNEYPHDPKAFTQGLFFADGALYESTGLNSQSTLRRVRLETGEILQKTELPADVFGEGIARWKGGIVALTWISQTGYVFDFESLERRKIFNYAGEGWGLTADGERLIMSDGTAELRFLDPKTLRETGRLGVTHKGKPLVNLNELEWIEGEIWANVWLTDYVVRIDPETGATTAVVDLRPLKSRLDKAPKIDEVLNGVAYDAEGQRIFVTGKNWPKLFEIRLVSRAKAGK